MKRALQKGMVVRVSGNFYTDLIYFVIYSFAGWVCEVICCSMEEKRFVNRGFLNGPACPIYGCGALLVIAALTPFRDKVWLVFISGLVLVSALEYITSYLMERIFHARWWDYSGRLGNINGRICLSNCIAFGVMGTMVLYVVHPWVEQMVGNLTYFWIQVVAVLLVAVGSADAALTIQSLLGLNETLARFKREVSATVAQRLEQVRDSLEGMQASLSQTASEMREMSFFRRYSYNRLFSAFPKVHSNRFEKQMEEMRRGLREYRAYTKQKKNLRTTQKEGKARKKGK